MKRTLTVLTTNHSKGFPMRKTLTALLTAGLLAGGGVASASVLPGAVHGTRVTKATFTTVTVPAGTVIAGNYGSQTDATSSSVATYTAQGYLCLGTGSHVIFGRPTLTYTCFLPQ